MAFIHPDTPPFHHPEITCLYEKGLRIEAAELQTILSLPMPTLVQDLERILADTREHFTYYENFLDEEVEDAFQDAPLHAIMLLGELQSKSSLPFILEWLSGSEEFLDFWLGDHITETIWEPIYKLLPVDWELLETFLKNPDVNMFARDAATQALNQLILQQPAYRATVVPLYERVLTYYQLHPSATEADDFVSVLVSEIFEVQAKELIPQIAALHDTIQLDEMLAGEKEEIVKNMERTPVIRAVMPVTERYQEIITTWAGYKDTNEESADELLEENDTDWESWDDSDDDESELLPIRTEP